MVRHGIDGLVWIGSEGRGRHAQRGWSGAERDPAGAPIAFIALLLIRAEEAREAVEQNAKRFAELHVVTDGQGANC